MNVSNVDATVAVVAVRAIDLDHDEAHKTVATRVTANLTQPQSKRRAAPQAKTRLRLQQQ